ncbi:MAG: ABC transporter ATP-binding protein [Thermoplasmata archaeon]|nr:ABC transporter ATP-binding protein [Thermoplasmata archaeon]
MPSLEARHLTKRYGTFFALSDASFKFDGNGAIGYLGPNGAGKTTTLKMMTQLARPSSGEAFINGIDVQVDPKRALWEVGSVIESPEPYPWQTSTAALEMVGDLRGMSRAETRARTRELTTELDLPPMDRKTGKLSKGQRQRVVIASALLSDPSIIVLDEPTSGLDPAERIAIRNILLRLKKERLILMSSHLLSEVTEICDRAVFINQGKILLNDTVAAISSRYAETEVDVEFTGPVPVEKFVALSGLADGVNLIEPARFRITYDGRDETRVAILRKCIELGPVRTFAGATLTLEDAYMKLIGADSRSEKIASTQRR